MGRRAGRPRSHGDSVGAGAGSPDSLAARLESRWPVSVDEQWFAASHTSRHQQEVATMLLILVVIASLIVMAGGIAAGRASAVGAPIGLVAAVGGD